METKECNEEEQCVQSAVKPTAIASCSPARSSGDFLLLQLVASIVCLDTSTVPYPSSHSALRTLVVLPTVYF